MIRYFKYCLNYKYIQIMLVSISVFISIHKASVSDDKSTNISDIPNNHNNTEVIKDRITWDSNKIVLLKTKCSEIEKNYPQTKEGFQSKSTALMQIINDNLSKNEIHLLALNCDNLPTNSFDWDNFTQNIICLTIIDYLEAGEKDNLIYVISKRFPERIYYTDDFEYVLVSRADKIKDPIDILGNAYDKCKIPEIKKKIAESVKRAFIGYGFNDADDTKNVHNAMQWYEQNKNQLVINKKYVYNTESNIYYGSDTYIKNPLFIKK